MTQATVFLTVLCPQCGIQTATEFPTIVVVTALTQWNNMRLYGARECTFWDASADELQQFRDQVGLDWMQENTAATLS